MNLYSILFSFIGLILIHVLYESHPVGRSNFYPAVWIQFSISFISYFYSKNLGRIVTIVSAFTLVRLGAHIGLLFPIPTLSGVFWGAITAIAIRESFSSESKKRESFQPNFWLIGFVLMLLLERYLVYFNFPYFKGFPEEELIYLKNLSSRSAFSQTVELLVEIYFPLAYLFLEEKTSSGSELYKIFRKGFLVGIIINSIVIAIQSTIDISFLSRSTNLALIVNRPPGLFRDTGTSTWIMPVSFLYFFRRHIFIFSRAGFARMNLPDFLKKMNKNKRVFYVFIFYTFIIFFFGLKQGRIYWPIVFLLYPLVLLYVFKKLKSKLYFYTQAYFILFWLIVVSAYFSYSFRARLSPSVQKIYSSFEGGVKEGNWHGFWVAVDFPRYYLNKSAFQIFKMNPIYGGGAGSFVVYLKDRSIDLSRPPGDMIDGPGSFYTGILSEAGILGSSAILFWAVLNLFSTKSLFNLNLLIIPFGVGYQVYHPDGSFFILFFLSALSRKKKYYLQSNFNKVYKIFMILVLILWTGKIISEYPIEGRGPDFRFEKIGNYQLQAFEENRNSQCHLFKAGLAWKIGDEDGIIIRPFLDDSTSRKELQLKFIVLDAKFQELNSKIEKISKGDESEILLETSGGKYVEVLEILPDGSRRLIDLTPFCLSPKSFDPEMRLKGDFISQKKS